MDRSKGVIYIAFGDLYVAEAIHSARSLKNYSALPITLFTDRSVDGAIFDAESCFDEVVAIEPQHKRAKVDFIGQSPYDLTLYLDSDTEIRHDITEIFELLDRFDIAAAHDHSRKSSRWSINIPAYAAIPYSFSEYNGGVVLYRKNQKTERFFDTWRHLFHAYKEHTNGQDQASFRIGLWRSDLAIYTLPPEFNVRNDQIRKKMIQRSKRPDDAALLKPRIYHWHGLDRPKLLSRFRSKYRPMKY